MAGKLKVKLSKCYLVQVLDEAGNEIKCEYVFGDRSEAETAGRTLKEEAEQEE